MLHLVPTILKKQFLGITRFNPFEIVLTLKNTPVVVLITFANILATELSTSNAGQWVIGESVNQGRSRFYSSVGDSRCRGCVLNGGSVNLNCKRY